MAIEMNPLPPNSNTDSTNEITELENAPKTYSFKTEPVQLSELAAALQETRAHMTQKSDIDINKVNAYRTSIAKGIYVINADSIARQLLKLDHFLKRK